MSPQSQIVVLGQDGTPRASTEIIAAGMNYQHATVIKLVRRHLASLEEFGLVRFEIRARQEGVHGGGDAEYALLSEPQSALLISMMRNSKPVIDFKVSLVKEFYSMREALQNGFLTNWQKRLELEMRDQSSFVRASFGSRLMLDRKQALPDIRSERALLKAEMEPPLFLN